MVKLGVFYRTFVIHQHGTTHRRLVVISMLWAINELVLYNLCTMRHADAPTVINSVPQD